MHEFNDMTPEELDEVPWDEVILNCQRGHYDHQEYWRHIALNKLEKYQELMPKMAGFVPNFDWKSHFQKLLGELERIERTMPLPFSATLDSTEHTLARVLKLKQ